MDKASAGGGDGYSVDILKSDGGPFGKLRLCTGMERNFDEISTKLAGSCFVSKREIHVGVWYHVAVVFQNTNVFFNEKFM